MKLMLQIAGGIFLAGLISWIFWMTILAAAAPHVAAAIKKALPETQITAPPGSAARDRVTPTTPSCVDFAEKANHEKHCLEDLHTN